VNKVEGFLVHEARLLDERRFEEWMELFTPEGYYWAPSRPDQQDPWTEVSLMFDDREIMQNRIGRLRHPKIYAQMPHSRATRQVSNVGIDSVDEASGEMTVRSVLFMFEYRPTLPHPIERLFAATCFHRLRSEGAGFRIASKKVQLTNCDAPFDPLFLYF
jgi:3-phenylpropionate/cinnamic acid dioxygenase small subunit